VLGRVSTSAKLVDSKVNSPENGVYMNDADHYKFGRFLFYFEKVRDTCLLFFYYLNRNSFSVPDLPNKYKVQMTQPGYRLGNGKVTSDVEFLENEGVLPPSPQFLNIHAAFAKVLARSVHGACRDGQPKRRTDKPKRGK